MKRYKFIGGSLQGQSHKAPGGNEIYIKFNDVDDDMYPAVEYYNMRNIGGNEVYLLTDLNECEHNYRPLMKEAGLL